MEDTNPLAGTDELDSPLRTKYLGVIDRMRELGINNEISLPQVGLAVPSAVRVDTYLITACRCRRPV